MRKNQSSSRPRQPKTGFKPHSLSENKLRLSKPDLLLLESTKENIEMANVPEKLSLEESSTRDPLRFLNTDDTNENISEGIVKIPYPIYKSLSPLNGLLHSESVLTTSTRGANKLNTDLTQTTMSSREAGLSEKQGDKKIVFKTKGKILKGKFGLEFLKMSGKKLAATMVESKKEVPPPTDFIDVFEDMEAVKFMEIQLAREKSQVAMNQHNNDELAFQIKSLKGDLSTLKEKWTLKDTELKESYTQFEKMKRKYANLQQKISYLERANKNLVAQMSDFLKIKMLKTRNSETEHEAL